VTPAAKREAVAHLVETYEMSERRACRLIRADRKTVGYRSGVRGTKRFGVACESWRPNSVGSAIAVCMSCCAPKAIW
jgi:hypothetical protein